MKVWGICSAFGLALSAVFAGETPTNGLFAVRRPFFTGSLSCDVRTGYLTTSGSLCDTEPISTQCLDYRFNLGDYGYINGYAWTISNLTGRNCEKHRMAFNEFEGVVNYGYRWRFTEKCALNSQAGILWNPQIGYPDDSWEYRGVRWVEIFENEYLNVGFNALQMIAPNESARVVVMLDRAWRWNDFTIKPSFQAVWSDGHRYKAKYAADPVHGLFGGAFATITLGLRATYRVNEYLNVFAMVQEYVVIDQQARDRVKESELYYSQTDRAVGSFGVEIPF